MSVFTAVSVISIFPLLIIESLKYFFNQPSTYKETKCTDPHLKLLQLVAVRVKPLDLTSVCSLCLNQTLTFFFNVRL